MPLNAKTLKLQLLDSHPQRPRIAVALASFPRPTERWAWGGECKPSVCYTRGAWPWEHGKFDILTCRILDLLVIEHSSGSLNNVSSDALRDLHSTGWEIFNHPAYSAAVLFYMPTSNKKIQHVSWQGNNTGNEQKDGEKNMPNKNINVIWSFSIVCILQRWMQSWKCTVHKRQRVYSGTSPKMVAS